MGYEIELVEAPERPTAVVPVSTTWPELPAEAGSAFDEVWDFLRRQDGLRFDGHNVILYKDGVPNVEVGVIVARLVVGEPGAIRLPRQRVRAMHDAKVDRAHAERRGPAG